MIFFSSIKLARKVHAQGLGLTDFLCMFSWGADAAQAQRHAVAFLEGSGVAVQRVYSTSPAQKQELRSYTFPEAIHGAPSDLVLTCLRSKWDGAILTESIESLRKHRHAVDRGLELLATWNA